MLSGAVVPNIFQSIVLVRCSHIEHWKKKKRVLSNSQYYQTERSISYAHYSTANDLQHSLPLCWIKTGVCTLLLPPIQLQWKQTNHKLFSARSDELVASSLGVCCSWWILLALWQQLIQSTLYLQIQLSTCPTYQNQMPLMFYQFTFIGKKSYKYYFWFNTQGQAWEEVN